jgi:hypothetical protein
MMGGEERRGKKPPIKHLAHNGLLAGAVQHTVKLGLNN